MYSLRLLGGLALEGSSGPVSGPATQPVRLALLVVLAVPEARPVTREKAATLLWPEHSAGRGRRNLSDTLYVLRKELGQEVIRASGETLRLDPERVRTDVAVFRRALERGEPVRAVEAYGGPLLDGVHLRDSVAFERWIDARREQLARQHEEALANLARAARDTGDADAAVRWGRELVAARPYSTSAAVGLMRALERAGDPAAAVRVGRLHQQRLQEELGAEPDPTLHEELERIRTSPRPGERPRETEAARPDPRTLRRALSPAALVLAVVVLALYAGLHLSDATERGAAGIRSVAVLPLESLTPRREAEPWFVYGMTDALTAELGRIDELTVLSGSSARQLRESEKSLPEIAHDLGVDALIEGSVLRDGDRVRITVELIHGRTHRQLWADSYERDLRNVLDLQAEVARGIAGEIEATVSSAGSPEAGAVTARARGEKRPNPRAYEAYLKGRYHFDRWGATEYEKAMRYFQDAIAIDSTFALAHAALADLCLRPSIFNVHMTLGDCRKSALTAVRLDDGSAEAHAALGRVESRLLDWEGAEEEFRRAVELRPNSALIHRWYADFLSTTLQRERALEESRRAAKLDPLNPLVKTLLAVQLGRAGRSEEADEQLDEVLGMNDEFVLAHLVSATMGEPAEAVEHARRAASRLGEDPIRPRLVTAVAHARSGDSARALEILRGVERKVEDRPNAPVGFIAIVHKHLGHDEESLAWLEKGLERDPMSLAAITSEPQFDDLRDDPRFREIRRWLGLR